MSIWRSPTRLSRARRPADRKRRPSKSQQRRRRSTATTGGACGVRIEKASVLRQGQFTFDGPFQVLRPPAITICAPPIKPISAISSPPTTTSTQHHQQHMLHTHLKHHISAPHHTHIIQPPYTPNLAPLPNTNTHITPPPPYHPHLSLILSPPKLPPTHTPPLALLCCFSPIRFCPQLTSPPAPHRQRSSLI